MLKLAIDKVVDYLLMTNKVVIEVDFVLNKNWNNLMQSISTNKRLSEFFLHGGQ